MNGYKRILYQAQRELERCRDRMTEAKREGDSTEMMRWVKHSMACEDIIIYTQQKIEVQK